MDSIAVVEREEANGDTLKTGKRKGFHVQDILLGNSYRFKKKGYLRYYSPLTSLNFNTVEGYVFNIRLRYLKRFEEGRRIELEPILRYGFSRGKLIGRGKIEYRYGNEAIRRGYLTLNAGKYTYQYNAANPIHPLVNTFTTLFLKENYMKIYESGFVTFENRGKLADNLGYRAKLTWSERTNLQNNTSHTWIKQDKEYTSNDPVNFELADTNFKIAADLISSKKTYEYYSNEFKNINRLTLNRENFSKNKNTASELSYNIGSENRKEQSEEEKAVEDRLEQLAEVLSSARIQRVQESDTQKTDIFYRIPERSKIISETLAKIYLSQGERSEAIKVYERLIKKNPLKESYYLQKIKEIRIS